MQRETALQILADLTEARRDAAARYDHADAEWRDGIKVALAAGCTRPEVAAEAGVNRQRVWQIENNTR